jgi:membrane fusion protein, multidrug efflux system
MHRFAALVISMALLLSMIVVGAGPLVAVDGASKKSAAAPIEVPNCSVMLFDDVTLAFDRTGIVETIVQEGDMVSAGQLVAKLNDEVGLANVAVLSKEAESDVDIRYARAAGKVAWAEHEKAEEANKIKSKAIPEVEIKKLKLAAERTDLEAEAAEHRHKIAGLKRDEAVAQLNTYSIRAPVSGLVTRVHRAQGEAVRQGDDVIEISNTDFVRVEAWVKVRDAVRIGANDEVTVQVDDPAYEPGAGEKPVEFTGRIVFVDVKVEPVSKDVRVWAKVRNENNQLKAGLSARMTIGAKKAPSDKTAG